MEIDETVVVKRKYERGRLPAHKEVWLFGGVERDTKHEKCFLTIIEGQRRTENLIPMIQEHIRLGSIIYSDRWRAYNPIPTLPQGYTHFTVNHSQNFVDPDTGCHTQNI